MVSRGDIWLAALGPTVGSEIERTRPCVVVSPQELNDNLRTVVVVPLTTGSKSAPFRIATAFEAKRGFMLLEQIRTLEKTRLVKRLGTASPQSLSSALRGLQDMFAH
ncbi:MAG: type II toxin-antitoxin system PemK/MazF family toxin [Vulcanimicrobiaceae bacterium]